MSDYSTSAALGFIQGEIIGQGIATVMKAKREAEQRLREQAAYQNEQLGLEAQLWAMRDRAIEAEIACRNENSRLALANLEIKKLKLEITDREVEIAKRDYEIHSRGEALADAELKVMDLEQKLTKAKNAHDSTLGIVHNLTYAFRHYRRLLKIAEKGGDAYDYAYDDSWSPLLVPPEQRTDPPDADGLTEYDRAHIKLCGFPPRK